MPKQDRANEYHICDTEYMTVATVEDAPEIISNPYNESKTSDPKQD